MKFWDAIREIYEDKSKLFSRSASLNMRWHHGIEFFDGEGNAIDSQMIEESDLATTWIEIEICSKCGNHLYK